MRATAQPVTVQGTEGNLVELKSIQMMEVTPWLVLLVLLMAFILGCITRGWLNKAIVLAREWRAKKALPPPVPQLPAAPMATVGGVKTLDNIYCSQYGAKAHLYSGCKSLAASAKVASRSVCLICSKRYREEAEAVMDEMREHAD